METYVLYILWMKVLSDSIFLKTIWQCMYQNFKCPYTFGPSNPLLNEHMGAFSGKVVGGDWCLLTPPVRLELHSVFLCDLTQPMKEVFALHREKVRLTVRLLAAVNPEGSQLPSPKPLVRLGGHRGIWKLF